MSELFTKLLRSQSGDKDSIIELCEQFSPLLKKYSNLLHFEDAYDELLLAFLECIHRIPLDKGKFKENDMYILSYIKTSVKNSYIALSKQHKKSIKIIYTDKNSKFIIDKVAHTSYAEEVELKLFLKELKEKLTDNEYNLFVLKYIKDLSESEIACLFGITRQAVNKRLKRIKSKIKVLYEV